MITSWIDESRRKTEKEKKKKERKKKRKIYKVIVANSKKRFFREANNSIVFFHEQFLFQRIFFQPMSKKKIYRYTMWRVELVHHCNFKRNVTLISWQKEN